MNRRKAIGRIVLIGGGTAVAYSGYKWWDWNKKPDLAWLDQKKELITSLAEAIIPATDTPGAAEAGVGDYIIIMIKDCTGIREQNKFIDGLKELEHHCSSAYDKPFPRCTEAEQKQVLQYFEQKDKPFKGIAGKAQNKFLGKSFFTTLKEYTVSGYCSSELGATKGLAYVFIPGRYQGCIPLQTGQKTWATK
jgi:hypothetical protein